MPGPDYAGIVTFYEDFPYAWWNEFRGLDDLGANPFAGLPADVSVRAEFADITDQLERKIMGITCTRARSIASSTAPAQMAEATRAYGRAMAELGGVDGAAERYWASGRVRSRGTARGTRGLGPPRQIFWLAILALGLPPRLAPGLGHLPPRVLKRPLYFFAR